MDTDKNAHGCYTDNEMKGISTDRFSFEYFIRNDLLYVDKTMYVHDLVSHPERNFFFLSRPRRFGKSLFCSTLHALFDGRKDLFKGLYIAEETDYSFEKYPVIHLDFSKMSLLSEQSVLSAVQKGIIGAAAANGVSIGMDDPSMMLDDLITRAMEKTGKPVVIIIDEFDSPFTSKISRNSGFVEYMRDLFNGIYKTIKADSGYIRFFFITGCVKLANLSIFSAMNNLKDISMDSRFAGAFGYTDDEVERFFREGIDEYLAANPEKYRSREEFIGRIREYYDGYRFSPRSDVRVYNPVSLGSFFSDGCVFDNYWNATGVSTMAVNIAARHDLSGYFENSIMATSEAFSSFDISCAMDPWISESSIVALLYYAGYLTMEYEEDGILYLGFPNREIKTSFASSLLSRYTGKNDFMGLWLAEFRAMCRTGRAEEVCRKLIQYFNAFSYELVGDEPERFYHSVFHAIFVIAGIPAISEDRGLWGRADEAIMAGNHLWIFELKVDGSAAEALKQIEERGYADKYAYLVGDRVKVHKLGISFSSQQRTIVDWKVSEG